MVISMNNLVEQYYQIHDCINACKTIGGLSICAEKINDMQPCGMKDSLADQELQKRIELLTKRYAETE